MGYAGLGGHMKPKVARKAGTDGWKAVTVDDEVIGHVKKIGDFWRAQKGNRQYLGFETQKAAAEKLRELL
jgi:hypothetical protein